jgi:ketosteroid isomerase-like protein
MRSQFEALNRGDFDLFRVRCHPEVELDVASAAPSGLMMDIDEVYRGYEGLERFFRLWFGEWEGYRVELEELIDTGTDLVVVLGRESGRGRASGIEIARPIAFVVTFRDGLAVRLQAFSDTAKALEQIGIPT